VNYKEISIKAQEIKQWMINIRRDFHSYPEIGMEEFRTSKKIREYLDELGIKYQYNIAKTGIVALIEGKKEGKTVALRADMDALPLEDKKEAPYSSKYQGKCHACGHDAHMAALLGAAKLLKDMEHQLKGNVKLIFQPAEETVGGAKPMLEEGAFENPRVDAVFGLHVDSSMDTGQVGIRYGQMNASSDTLEIRLYGKNAHGAYPHSGIDAVVMAAHIVTALQSIVSRNVDPRDCAVVSIGKIRGGTQGNIIADKVEMTGTLRTLDPNTREMALCRIGKIVQDIPSALGGLGELDINPGYAALINNNAMVDLVKNNAQRLVTSDNINIIQKPSLGVEDFAYFAKAAPGAFFTLGCRNKDKGIIHEHHNSYFDIDEDCLPIGAAIQVLNALSLIT
jgi:amidohydrolase